MKRIENNFFSKNREMLSARLEPNSVAILNSNDEFPRNGDQEFPFRQNSDLFYLTGIDQERTILLLYPDCPNKDLREVLFIRKADANTIIWEGFKYLKPEATLVSGIAVVRWLDDFEIVLTEVMSFADRIYLNNVEYPKYFNQVPYRDLRFGIGLREMYPNHEFRRLAPIMASLRTIKSITEIDLIQEAIKITDGAFRRILEFVKPGVMEYHVQAEIEHEFRWNRAKNAYQPIIASGENACVLHYTDNDRKCNDGDLLLMDFGAEYFNYAADLSRTIPVNGRFSERQKEAYMAVLYVQREAIKLLTPGNTIDSLNKEVNILMQEKMIELGLFTQAEVNEQDPESPLFLKYYMHGTSHFLGLDVHDVGSKYEPFKHGMIFTCEPGIYIREEGFGIRIENNILVTENGPVDLTIDVPIEPGEIEELMNK